MALKSISTINVTEDTEIREAPVGASGTDKNYSTDSTLRVGAIDKAGTQQRSILLDFGMTTLTGKTLDKITLTVAVSQLSTAVSPMVIRVLLYDTGEVDLSQSTWNNRTTASTWDGSAGAATSGTDYSTTEVTTDLNGDPLVLPTGAALGVENKYDVTSLVQIALDNGYSSIFLKMEVDPIEGGNAPIVAKELASGLNAPTLTGTIKVRRKIKKSDVKIKQSTRATLSGARVQHTTIQAGNISDILINAHLETQYQLFEEQMPTSGPPLMTLSSSSSIATNGNLVTLNKEQMEIILKDNFPYKVRMRYRDSDGWTPWSEAASFRTRSKDYKHIREGSQ